MPPSADRTHHISPATEHTLHHGPRARHHLRPGHLNTSPCPSATSVFGGCRQVCVKPGPGPMPETVCLRVDMLFLRGRTSFLLSARARWDRNPNGCVSRTQYRFFQMTRFACLLVLKVKIFLVIWISCFYNTSHGCSLFTNKDLEQGQQAAGQLQPAVCLYK